MRKFLGCILSPDLFLRPSLSVKKVRRCLNGTVTTKTGAGTRNYEWVPDFSGTHQKWSDFSGNENFGFLKRTNQNRSTYGRVDGALRANHRIHRAPDGGVVRLQKIFSLKNMCKKNSAIPNFFFVVFNFFNIFDFRFFRFWLCLIILFLFIL